MSEIIEAIVLGIVQGITEFLPISSDGHLVLVPNLLGWGAPSLLLITMLHWGTLAAILVVFWRDFWMILQAALKAVRSGSWRDPYARLAYLIIIGTAPVAIGGLLVKDWIETLLDNTAATGAFLLVTAVLLAGSEWMATRWSTLRTITKIDWLDAFLIGSAQIIALLPGVSRSGSTIATGLVRGIGRADAARFSFLIGAPAIFGAGLLETVDALSAGGGELAAQGLAIVIGVIVSGVTGLLAIRFLLSYLRRGSLYPFALYCTVVGLLVMVWPLFG